MNVWFNYEAIDRIKMGDHSPPWPMAGVGVCGQLCLPVLFSGRSGPDESRFRVHPPQAELSSRHWVATPHLKRPINPSDWLADLPRFSALYD